MGQSWFPIILSGLRVEEAINPFGLSGVSDISLTSNEPLCSSEFWTCQFFLLTSDLGCVLTSTAADWWPKRNKQSFKDWADTGRINIGQSLRF